MTAKQKLEATLWDIANTLRGKMNARQEKVIARLFREGPEGFKGSMPFRVETDERRVV